MALCNSRLNNYYEILLIFQRLIFTEFIFGDKNIKNISVKDKEEIMLKISFQDGKVLKGNSFIMMFWWIRCKDRILSIDFYDMTKITFSETYRADTRKISPRICRRNFNSPYTYRTLSNEQRTITGHRPGGLKVIFRGGCLVGGTNLWRYSVPIEERKNEGRTGKAKEGKETDVEAKGQRSSTSVKEI